MIVSWPQYETLNIKVFCQRISCTFLFAKLIVLIWISAICRAVSSSMKIYFIHDWLILIHLIITRKVLKQLAKESFCFPAAHQSMTLSQNMLEHMKVILRHLTVYIQLDQNVKTSLCTTSVESVLVSCLCAHGTIINNLCLLGTLHAFCMRLHYYHN